MSAVRLLGSLALFASFASLAFRAPAPARWFA